MKGYAIALLLLSSYCYAQTADGFHPASSNVLDAQYPKVDSNSRVEIRFKAPDASKVKLNFWSGPKVDMEKQADGFWASLLRNQCGWRRGERSGQHSLFRRQQMGQRR
jgi:enterochelin esterase family protein